jgi:hypothetical protein
MLRQILNPGIDVGSGSVKSQSGDRPAASTTTKSYFLLNRDASSSNSSDFNNSNFDSGSRGGISDSSSNNNPNKGNPMNTTGIAAAEAMGELVLTSQAEVACLVCMERLHIARAEIAVFAYRSRLAAANGRRRSSSSGGMLIAGRGIAAARAGAGAAVAASEAGSLETAEKMIVTAFTTGLQDFPLNRYVAFSNVVRLSNITHLLSIILLYICFFFSYLLASIIVSVCSCVIFCMLMLTKSSSPLFSSATIYDISPIILSISTLLGGFLSVESSRPGGYLRLRGYFKVSP